MLACVCLSACIEAHQFSKDSICHRLVQLHLKRLQLLQLLLDVVLSLFFRTFILGKLGPQLCKLCLLGLQPSIPVALYNGLSEGEGWHPSDGKYLEASVWHV